VRHNSCKQKALRHKKRTIRAKLADYEPKQTAASIKQFTKAWEKRKQCEQYKTVQMVSPMNKIPGKSTQADHKRLIHTTLSKKKLNHGHQVPSQFNLSL
jgi:hypothetical protein